MEAYRIETQVDQNSSLVLTNLPFHEGETVEVLIIKAPLPMKNNSNKSYVLRGTPVKYIEPTEPVAKEDWEALK
ncbi:MAG: hypothetical protein HQM11_00985 [SAR324 cluster bacterium]|nr:hypothetical protein [SAR324 cluster bacterium]